MPVDLPYLLQGCFPNSDIDPNLRILEEVETFRPAWMGECLHSGETVHGI